MGDHSTEQLIIGLYALMWIILRLVASRTASPTKVRVRSPLLTILMMFYTLGCCVLAVSRILVLPAWTFLPTLRNFSIGALLLGISLLLLLFCLKHLHRYYAFEIEIKDHHKVVASGPYRFFRHPIYLSDVLGYLGVCLVISNWLVWVALPVYVLALHLMAIREEGVLCSTLGNDYAIYRHSTRGFLLIR